MKTSLVVNNCGDCPCHDTHYMECNLVHSLGLRKEIVKKFGFDPMPLTVGPKPKWCPLPVILLKKT